MKRIPQEAILADARKRIAKYRGSARWLNKAVKFDHSLILAGDQKEKLDFILELCGTKNRKENYLNLEILIANLLHKRDKSPVMVSLNTLEWKKTRYIRAGESTIKLIHKLHKLGYINLKIGYRTEKESKKTRIWPTKKLLNYFPLLDSTIIYDPPELVQLKSKNGKLEDYDDTTKTDKIRSILTRINKVNQSAKIQYKNYRLNPILVAIYRRKFTLYGRLHTRGYWHHQGLSSNDRKEITINNDSVVELDYSGLRPHLLYANEGIQLDKDPYNIFENRPVIRTFLKHILLCMLNADNEL